MAAITFLPAIFWALFWALLAALLIGGAIRAAWFPARAQSESSM